MQHFPSVKLILFIICARQIILSMMSSEQFSAYSVFYWRTSVACLLPRAAWWCTHSFTSSAKWLCQQPLWINVKQMRIQRWKDFSLPAGQRKTDRERDSKRKRRNVWVWQLAGCSFDCSFIMPMPGAGTFKELCHKLTLDRMCFSCFWQWHVAGCMLHIACCSFWALLIYIKLTAACFSLGSAAVVSCACLLLSTSCTPRSRGECVICRCCSSNSCK